MGARKTVVSRRAVLVIGGLTLLAAIEKERSKPSVASGEMNTGNAGRPNPAPNQSQSVRPQLAQAKSAQTKSAQSSSAGPSAAHSTPHPSQTMRTEAAKTKAGQAEPDKTSASAEQEPMYVVNDGRKRIALTIDDGPSPVYTPQVLALLEQYGITAMFSMIGIQARAYPGVAREVADAGHVIANHTWTHLNLAELPLTLVADQITRATGAIYQATGRTPALFRAPYGAWSPELLGLCAESSLTPVDWSVDPRDWARPGVTSIVRNIMRNTKTGSIILEHDGGGNRSETVAALKIVLPRLIDAGYRFVTP